MFGSAAVAAPMRGRVIDAETRQPIENAIVFAGEREATTGADGSFEIDPLATITVLADGHKPMIVSIKLARVLDVSPRAVQR